MKNVVVVLMIFLIGALIGIAFRARSPIENSPIQKISSGETWTCSMHPQIKQEDPGLCPLCGMDLILLNKNEPIVDGQPEIHLSEYAKKLAEVETFEVVQKNISKKLRASGILVYDETLLKTITARVPGRVDRLFVDYTGVKVEKKDHLVSLYSPELFAAQEELIQSYLAMEKEKSFMKDMDLLTLESIKRKFELWGFEETQIQEIIASKKPSEQMTIYSPVEGVVIEKKITEGTYVQAGSPLYRIADLSHLWLKIDIYESDLAWIKYGQEVEFKVEAWPGESFQGKIIFIDPTVDHKTRTVKVRVGVPNKENKLKPHMFVRAQVDIPLLNQGGSRVPDLKGKWISPMHPEVIKDEPGNCDVCGMKLVKAETLFPDLNQDVELPVVIPKSAPLLTGKRARVYVEVSPGQYRGKDIVLGPKSEDYYVVKEGLSVGEKVVSRGNFKIDSAMQIMGESSMMNPNKHNPNEEISSESKNLKEESDQREEDKPRSGSGSHKQGSHHHGSHKH